MRFIKLLSKLYHVSYSLLFSRQLLKSHLLFPEIQVNLHTCLKRWKPRVFNEEAGNYENGLLIFYVLPSNLAIVTKSTGCREHWVLLSNILLKGQQTMQKQISLCINLENESLQGICYFHLSLIFLPTISTFFA